MTSTDDEYKFSIQYFNCQANKRFKKKKLETSYTYTKDKFQHLLYLMPNQNTLRSDF